MIPGLPSPWVLLGSVLFLLAAVTGAFFEGSHWANMRWQLKIEIQAKEAQKLIADKTAEIAKTVEANAELNRQLESDHAQAEKDIAAAHDDYERALAQRLLIAPSRISCPAPGSPKAVDPVASEAVDTPGILVHEQALRDIGNLMRESDTLLATMKQCKAFADSVGR